MREIQIRAEHDYSVLFAESYLKELLTLVNNRKVAVVVCRSIESLLVDLPSEWNRIIVPEGEDQKSGSTFLASLEKLAQLGMNRQDVIIGIGGGATTDLAGFLAASYLRGIDWISVPTSLAAMVDAAIGGKTGINLLAGKNLVGAFHSPRAVIIDEGFLASLSDRDVKAGMAEVAKCGFIADSAILDLIENGWREKIGELIYRAVAVKAKIVSEDFRESFAREVLNYGHTLGHAIEKHSGYSLRHGEAVSIGLVFAAEISVRFAGLSDSDLARHYRVLSAIGLPTAYQASAWPELRDLMQYDKKRDSSGVRFVGLKAMGVTLRLQDLDTKELESIYLSKIGR